VNGKLPRHWEGPGADQCKNAFHLLCASHAGERPRPADTATGPVEVDVITSHGTVVATVNLAALSPALFRTLYKARLRGGPVCQRLRLRCAQRAHYLEQAAAPPSR